MRRWTGIAGIVWVVLAFVSRLVRGSVPDPSGDHAVDKFASFYAKTSHQDHALTSAVVGLIGLFFFAWFVGGVISRLREAEGAPGAAMIVMSVAAGAFVALAAVTHVFDDSIGITLHFSSSYKLDPGLAVVMSTAGTGAFLASMIAVGAATAAAGVMILQTRALPVWIAWIGFAIAVLSLPTIPPLSFIAALLLAVWAVAVSVALLMETSPA